MTSKTTWRAPIMSMLAMSCAASMLLGCSSGRVETIEEPETAVDSQDLVATLQRGQDSVDDQWLGDSNDADARRGIEADPFWLTQPAGDIDELRELMPAAVALPSESVSGKWGGLQRIGWIAHEEGGGKSAIIEYKNGIQVFVTTGVPADSVHDEQSSLLESYPAMRRGKDDVSVDSKTGITKGGVYRHGVALGVSDAHVVKGSVTGRSYFSPTMIVFFVENTKYAIQGPPAHMSSALRVADLLPVAEAMIAEANSR